MEEKDISSIYFDVFSSEDIAKYSVCEINKTDLKNDVPNSIYDKRMGTLKKEEECLTCGEAFCCGHFGHIVLAEPIINPLFLRTVLLTLRCICYQCKKVIISNELFKLNELGNYKKIIRIKKIREDYKNCCYCMKEVGDYKVNKLTKKVETTFNKKNIIVSFLEIENIFGNLPREDILKLDITPINFIIRNLPVLPPCCRPSITIGDGVGHDDLTSKYIDIIKHNNALRDIIEEKLDVKKKGRKSKTILKKNDHYSSLQFYIETLIDNSKGKHRQKHGRPLKSFKDIIAGKKGRIRGNLMGKRCDYTARTVVGPGIDLKVDEVGIPQKIADNITIPIKITSYNKKQILEKISNQKIEVISTVKNPDTINEKTFSIKNYYNYQKYKLIDGDKIINQNSIIDFSRYKFYKGIDYKLKDGDIIVRKSLIENKEEKIVYKEEYTRLNLNLQEGDVINRKLQDNDWIVLNRQPTLHKASMMGHKVKIVSTNTIQMNVAACGPYNADFDGDEVNIHIPQSEDSKCEIQNLIALGENIVTEQSSIPTIKICQDAVTAGILLTQEYIQIDKDLFFNCCMEIQNDRLDILKRLDQIDEEFKKYWNLNPDKYKKLPPNFNNKFSGHSLFSLLLPDDLEYSESNSNVNVNNLKITKGVLVSGHVDSSVVGDKKKSLVKLFSKYYPVQVNIDFISNYQFVMNRWLTNRGFSVGISDCIIPDNIKKIVESKVNKVFDDIKNESNDNVIENLNNLRNIASKIYKEMLPNSNALKTMIVSGAKGNMNNIVQIGGFMGQQSIEDGRVPELIGRNHTKRTLAHYPVTTAGNKEYDFQVKIDEKTPSKIIDEYRLKYINARGFVFNNLLDGLTPQEFFFHAMGGRIGIIDTSLKTSVCGYITRQITKSLEDLVVTYTGTVTNSKSEVIAFNYGHDQMNAGKLVTVQGADEQFVNVQFLVDKINKLFE